MVGSTANAVTELPVCSTITGDKTDHCRIAVVDSKTNAKALVFDLTSTMQKIQVSDNVSGRKINIHHALVYNNSLAPERLELRRGDALEIHFTNRITWRECNDTVNDNCFPSELLAASGDHDPRQTNLHTHGSEVPWAFDGVPPDLYGDDVLTFVLDQSSETEPAGGGSDAVHERRAKHAKHAMHAMPELGNAVIYWYPFSPYHPIGLNWYHPHPHGVTGFQVEAGLAGLLTIGLDKTDSGDPEAALSPIYLQLKDMQTRKDDDSNYRFQKFEPAVASACFVRGKAEGNEEWEFNAPSVKGRCNYKNSPKNQDYSWFFFVNGELFPTIEAPKKSYFRIANNSSNATYRLTLVPADAKPGTYYVPPFEVVEKDGITSAEGTEIQCTPALTPATRAGFGVDFTKKVSGTGKLCKVEVIAGADGQLTFKTIPVENEQLSKLTDTGSYILMQQGINTGEDDWPAIELANVQLTDGPESDWSGYAKAVAAANDKAPKPNKDFKWSKLDVKEPDSSLCDEFVDLPPAAEFDRAVVLFFGEKDGSEVFGLVSSGETMRAGSPNAGQVVNADMIATWRNAYLDQFAENIVSPTGDLNDQSPLEYDAPVLDGQLAGLEQHKFDISKTNVCTTLGDKPERWRVYNLSAQIHNFHIHQTKFEVKNVQGAACSRPGNGIQNEPEAYKLVGPENYLNDGVTQADLVGKSDEQCVKTYAELFFDVPGQFTLAGKGKGASALAAAPGTSEGYGMHDTFPVPPMGYIDVEIPFDSPEKVGVYVFHCHILEHEDAGMMGKIVVRSR